MKFDKIIERLQNTTGAAKLELTAVFIILLGGILIYPAMQLYTESTEINFIDKDFYQVIDSLAEVNRSAYIGSSVDGSADSLLAIGDTIIEKESLFPQKASNKVSGDVQISLNNASKTELMKLPGVGESTALKIIEYRTNSKFKKISDIMNIKGIGEKKFEKMKNNLKL